MQAKGTPRVGRKEDKSVTLIKAQWDLLALIYHLALSAECLAAVEIQHFSVETNWENTQSIIKSPRMSYHWFQLNETC